MKKSYLLVLFCFSVCTFPFFGNAQIIQTIAGTGVGGYGGDGGPATAANLQVTVYGGIAVDAGGNKYIGDYNNFIVRKINVSGTITTIAGTPGVAGFLGDGGPATSARLVSPMGIAVDGSGNVYVAMYSAHKIRKVSATGTITTIAGTGSAGFSGDGGPATAAQLDQAWGVAVDNYGNIYIADNYNHRVRKIDASGIITTIAGTGSSGSSGDGGAATSAQLMNPVGIAVDRYRNVFVADLNACRIRKIDTNGMIRTVAGNGTGGFTGDGGAATSASLYNPSGVAIDTFGNIWISDSYNNRIRKVDTNGIIRTIAGTGATGGGTGSYGGDGGVATAANLHYPYGVAVDGIGAIYIVDNYNQRIRMVSGNNRPPVFTAGASSGMSLCAGATDTISALLAMHDSDVAQLEIWSLLSGPSHGIASVAYTAVSTGGIITPTGMTYTAATGYSGADTFYVSVSDGTNADTIAIYVNINPTPGPITGPTGLCVGSTTTLADTSAGGVWTSASTGVATIGSSSGIVTGVSGGTSVISYSNSFGCRSMTTVNVSATVPSITGLSTVCMGLTTPLTASVPGGTWTSGSPSVASIGSSSGVVTGLSVGATAITYSIGGTCNTTSAITVNVSPGPITGLPALCVGSSITLSDTTAGGVWTSTNILLATVGSSSGIVLGIAGGIDTIRYTISNGCYAFYRMTVNPTPVISSFTYVYVGSTLYLTAFPAGGTWSSGSTSTASIGSMTGIVSGVAVGSAPITYMYGSGCVTTTTVTVVPPVTGLPVITTIAGSSAGYSGDGGAATAAELNQPLEVVTDGAGNTYIADFNNNRVRMINSAGVITTIAGTGVPGYSGDGGAATAAQLNHPADVFLYGGEVYIADVNNHRIRKVSATGIITTIAGNGLAGPAGDGGPATAAQLNLPYSVTADPSGNIYIADYSNHKVRKINTLGAISTLAGTGLSGYIGDGGQATSAKLYYPKSVFADGAGNVYIADNTNHRIRVVNSIGVITTIVGIGTSGFAGDGGAAISARISFPNNIDFDRFGNMYIADGNNHRIRKVTSAGIISTVAGTGTSGFLGDGCAPTAARLNLPAGVSVDASGSLYIADNSNNRIRKLINNTTPFFLGGAFQNITLCQNGPADSINSILAVCDSNKGSGETWSVVAAPLHGTVFGSFSGTITSGVVMAPTGLSYTPAFGYSGNDSFRIKVTDCVGASDTITIRVLINPLPAAITGSTPVCVGASITLLSASIGGNWTSSDPTVAAVGLSTGTVTGISAGTATITYTLPTGCLTTAVVTVNTLPSPITGTSTTCVGSTTTLFSSPGGTWSSSSSGVAAVGSLTGIVAGVGPGVSFITYSVGVGCAVSFPVFVSAVPTAITGTLRMCQGVSSTLTNGVSGGYWTSGTTTVATIGSASGVVTGVGAGTSVITYAVAPGLLCAATAVVTVDALPGVVAGVPQVCVGQTTTLSCWGSGVWTSSAPSIAAVGSGTGIVSGVSAGVAIITYTLPSGCSTTVPVTVNALPAPITGAPNLCIWTATMMSSSPGGGSWMSSNPFVADIDLSTGNVTGVAVGSVMISYVITGGCYAVKPLTVHAAPGAITGASSLCAGTTTLLSNATPGGTWSSGSTGTATIGSASGLVTAGGLPGISVIMYSLGPGCSSTKTITVNPVPTTIIGPSGVCVGLVIGLSNGVPGGVWSRSNTNVVIGTSSGIVLGASAGTTVITYTLPSGCYITKTISVNASPGAITGSANICFGETSTLSNPTVGGTWSSSAPSIASVGAGTGIVTGLVPGTATIAYSIGTGCVATVIVTVNPAIMPVTGPSVVCEGSFITLADATPGGTWSGSSLAVSVGSLSGTVTGVSAGIAEITYTMPSGCTRRKMVTVNPLPTAPGGPSALCVSATLTLTSTPGGLWVSGFPSVATIGSMTGVVTGITTGATVITYTLPTGCKITKTITVSVSPGAITGSPTVCTGTGTPLSNAVPGGLWSSGGPGTASVGSLSGIVAGIATGTVTISYSLGAGCTVTRTMTVLPSPAPISGLSSICEGTSATYTDPTPGGVWSSGSMTTIMVGSASGLVTGVTGGTATVTYTISTTGCTATKPVTVYPNPVPITGLTTVCAGSNITLSDATPGGMWLSGSPSVATVGSATGIVTGVAAGTSTITYTIGSCRTTRMITINAMSPIVGVSSLCIGEMAGLIDATTGGSWSSGTPGVATVGSSSGLVTGISSGTTTITYTVPATGCFATRLFTVNAVPVAITGPATVCVGATVTESDATPGGVWSSSAPGMATIGSATGDVTGLAAGVFAITYSIGECAVTTVMSVHPVPAITGPSGVCIGATMPLFGTIPGGTWSSGMTSVAGVGVLSGVVTGISSGTAMITYTLPTGCMAATTVTVNSGPSLIGGVTNVCMTGTTTLTNLSGGGTWTSSTPSVATIGTSSGIVTGIAPGITTITYSLGTGCTITTPVTVNPIPAGITGPPALCEGTAITLGNSTTGGTWTSSSTSIATVGLSSGLVSGFVAGVATISYTLPTGCMVTRAITVNPIPAPILGTATVCVDGNTTLTDAVSGGLWSSSNALIAVIGSSSGIVTGVVTGTATITYLVSTGCRITRVVTVNPLPPSISGVAGICVGAVTTLTNSVSGGIWTSGTPGVATIGSLSGLVSGINAGTSLITYTLSTGCSINRFVTVHPIPSPIAGPGTVCIGTTVTWTDLVTGGTWSSGNPIVATVGSTTGIVAGVSVGSATITYTSAAGCRITRVATVNPLPPGILGPTNVCAGQTITLSNPAPGGTWSSGNISLATVGSLTGIVSGVAGGSVSISYTVPTGCSATHVVSVNAVPPITGLVGMCAWGDTITVHNANPAGTYSSSLITIVNLGSGNGRITTNAPGVGSLTYTLSSGCFLTVPVTVNSLPVSITGATHLCVGGTTSLFNASTGGTWSSGLPGIASVGSATGIVSGFATGTARITYTLPTGCKVDTPVHVDPPPTPIMALSGTVILGGTVLFMHDTLGGTWSSGAPSVATVGSSTGIVTGVSLGVATITYNMGSSCPATRTVTVVPGMSVRPDEDGIFVYPNPNNGTFTVKGRIITRTGAMNAGIVPDEEAFIEMTDMLGRQVHMKLVPLQNGHINERIEASSTLSNGMYILGVRCGNETRMFHIMIER